MVFTSFTKSSGIPCACCSRDLLERAGIPAAGDLRVEVDKPTSLEDHKGKAWVEIGVAVPDGCAACRKADWRKSAEYIAGLLLAAPTGPAGMLAWSIWKNHKDRLEKTRTMSFHVPVGLHSSIVHAVALSTKKDKEYIHESVCHAVKPYPNSEARERIYPWLYGRVCCPGDKGMRFERVKFPGEVQLITVGSDTARLNPACVVYKDRKAYIKMPGNTGNVGGFIRGSAEATQAAESLQGPPGLSAQCTSVDHVCDPTTNTPTDNTGTIPIYYGKSCSEETVASEEVTVKVTGPTHDTDIPIAAQIAPSVIPASGYGSQVGNLTKGLKERLQGKVHEPTLSRCQQRRIEREVKQIISDNLPAAKIRKWREENSCIQELLAGKKSLIEINQMLDASWDYIRDKLPETTLQVKPEMLPINKQKPDRPRVIFNDGDLHYTASCLVIKCFSDLWFGGNKNDHIKHLDKAVALEEAAKFVANSTDDQVFGEGDGSAWDFTCGEMVRNLIENKFLDHITDILFERGAEETPVLASRIEMHYRKVKHYKPKVNVKTKDTFGNTVKMVVKMIACRRSGDVGTSALNQGTNGVAWACSCLQRPSEYYKDLFDGTLKETYAMAYYLLDNPSLNVDVPVFYRCHAEGDDSFLGLDKKLHEVASKIENFWFELGFNMKIKWIPYSEEPQFGSYIGSDALIVKGKVVIWAPQLLRNLASSAWTTSRTCFPMAGKKQELNWHQVGADSLWARAMSHAKVYKEEAAYYMACSRWHASFIKGTDTVVDIDMSRKTGLCLGSNIHREEAYGRACAENTAANGQAANTLRQLVCGSNYDVAASAALVSMHTISPFDESAQALFPAEWVARAIGDSQ